MHDPNKVVGGPNCGCGGKYCKTAKNRRVSPKMKAKAASQGSDDDES